MKTILACVAAVALLVEQSPETQKDKQQSVVHIVTQLRENTQRILQKLPDGAEISQDQFPELLGDHARHLETVAATSIKRSGNRIILTLSRPYSGKIKNWSFTLDKTVAFDLMEKTDGLSIENIEGVTVSPATPVTHFWITDEAGGNLVLKVRVKVLSFLPKKFQRRYGPDGKEIKN